MVQPSVNRVSEVLLDLYGFDKPKEAAKKLSMLFSTLSTNLNLKNYDWSQRALKTILINASLEMANYLKTVDTENKELIKAESTFILLKAIHNIVRPTIRIVDMET